MTLPTADPNLLTGTPGGYLAGVTKPLAEQEEEKLFVRDVQKEVVGLRIVFNVNILDLAAVRAITGFGVQCNSEFVYSPAAGDCVALPEDVFEEEEFFEEEEEFFEEEADFEPDGEWTPVDALAAGGESLGRKIGRFLQGLPVISRLPIREIGEALLAWSVWLLLSIPLLLAWRRINLNLGEGQ